MKPLWTQHVVIPCTVYTQTEPFNHQDHNQGAQKQNIIIVFMDMNVNYSLFTLIRTTPVTATGEGARLGYVVFFVFCFNKSTRIKMTRLLTSFLEFAIGYGIFQDQRPVGF